MNQSRRCVRLTICWLVYAVFLLGVPIAAQAEDETEPLCGIWIDYSAESGGYKWVFDSDGKAFDFIKEYDKPFYEGRYFIEKKWTDGSGNTFYHCFTRWGFQPYRESKVIEQYYALIKIDHSSNTLQSVWSKYNYPMDFESGSQPRLHHRQ